MKVKVRRLRFGDPRMPALNASILWLTGKMPGEVYERVCLKYGKEHWLTVPSHGGEDCPSNGERPGIDCRCDNCDYFLACFPEEL